MNSKQKDSSLTPGDRVKAVRVTLDKSMEEFSEAIGKSRPTISQIEAGKTGISQDTAMAIQLAWKASWRWILTGEGPMWPEEAPQLSLTRQPADVVLVPAFEDAPSFEAGGEVVCRDQAVSLFRLRRSTIKPMLHRSKYGTFDTLCLVRIPADDSMLPTMTPGGMALVNTALEIRLDPPPGILMLVRLDARPCFRRVFVQPRPEEGGDWGFLLQTERPTDISRIEIAPNGVLEDLLLGMVCI